MVCFLPVRHASLDVPKVTEVPGVSMPHGKETRYASSWGECALCPPIEPPHLLETPHFVRHQRRRKEIFDFFATFGLFVSSKFFGH